MCDPVSVSIALGVAGGGANVAGGILEGRAAERDALAKKQEAEMAARDAMARGVQEAGRARTATSQLIGEQRVAYAASGVDPTQGTAAKTQADTRMVGELEALLVENNATREAWGLRRQAAAHGEQAKAYRTRTILGGVGGLLGMGGSALGAYGKKG